MAKRGGFGGMGMPGNMNNLMKQRQMEENKKALDEAEFKATAGGGAVEVVVTDAHEFKSLKINPEAVDPDDVEMLEDMIMAALNDAMKQISDKSAQMMGPSGFGM